MISAATIIIITVNRILVGVALKEGKLNVMKVY